MSKQMLEPCPLCGRKPHKMLDKKNDDGMQALIIACPTGHVRVACINHDAAIEEWNTRPQCSAVSAPACVHKSCDDPEWCAGEPVCRYTEPQSSKADDEIDYDNPRFNQGVEHVVSMLARTLDANGWVHGDGSEDYDCDLEQTLINILEAAGLYDADTGEFGHGRCQADSSPQTALTPEAAKKVVDDVCVLSTPPAGEYERAMHDVGTEICRRFDALRAQCQAESEQ